MQVYVFYAENNSQFSQKLWESLLNDLPANLHPGILRFYRWQDRQASLLGKMLLKKGIEQLGLEISLIEKMEIDEYGRPYLHAHIDFNISHTPGAVVCAITHNGTVGIDIEEIKKTNLEFYQDILSEKEKTALSNSQNPNEFFLHIWTKKEAVLKASGMGLANFTLSSWDALEKDVLLDNIIWHLHPVNISPEYACYLASSKETVSINLQKIEFPENYLPVSPLLNTFEE